MGICHEFRGHDRNSPKLIAGTQFAKGASICRRVAGTHLQRGSCRKKNPYDTMRTNGHAIRPLYWDDDSLSFIDAIYEITNFERVNGRVTLRRSDRSFRRSANAREACTQFNVDDSSHLNCNWDVILNVPGAGAAYVSIDEVVSRDDRKENLSVRSRGGNHVSSSYCDIDSLDGPVAIGHPHRDKSLGVPVIRAILTSGDGGNEPEADKPVQEVPHAKE